jgi:hypothetical protein
MNQMSQSYLRNLMFHSNQMNQNYQLYQTCQMSLQFPMFPMNQLLKTKLFRQNDRCSYQ